MKHFRKIISLTVSLMLLICVIPFSGITASAASTLTEEQFAQKLAEIKKEYPDGKYWNQYNGTSKVGNQNVAKAGDIICPGTSGGKSCKSNKTCALYGSCTCKCGSFHGEQCHGFANLVAYKMFGSYATNWVNASSNSDVNKNWEYHKSVSRYYAGDFIRLNLGSYGHSVFVTKVTSSRVYVVDCNRSGACQIDWDDSYSIDYLKKITIFVVHYKNNTLSGTGSTVHSLTMQYNANGGTLSDNIYTVTTDGDVGLWMRSSYSTSSSKLVLVPDDTRLTVTETKTSGGYTWGKTTYDGKTGWCAISIGAVKTYYLNSDTIYNTVSKKAYANSWNYGTGSVYGLTNNTTFGLSKKGYEFVGWSLSSDGSTDVFDQDDSSLKAENIYPDVKNKNATVTLYAIWKPVLRTIDSIEIASMPNQTVYYIGESIDLTGLKLKINYNDGSSELTGQCGISEFDSSTAGAKTLTVGYSDIFTTLEVTVKEPKITMPTELSLEAGQEKQLSLTSDPSDAKITYSSSDTEVVTVENGKIVAVANGKARVSAGITLNDISYISNCIVTVGDGIKASEADSPTFSVESKNNGNNKISVTVNLNNSDKVCDGNFTLCYNSDLLEVKSYTFGALLNDSSKLCNLDYLSEGNKIRVTFASVEELAKSGQVITFEFDVKSSGAAEFNFYSFNTYNASGKSLAAVADKKIVNVSKTEAERKLVSIAIDQMPQKTEYLIGESLNTAGLKLKLNYNDGTYETVTEGFSVTGFDSATIGAKTVTVSYEGKTTSYQIEVKASEISVDPNSPQIFLESKKVTTGQQFTVKVEVKNNPGFNTASVKIVYDTEKLKLISAELGESFATGATVSYDNLPYVTFIRANNITSDSTVLLLSFEAINVGESNISLEFSNGDISNVDEEDVNFAVVDGKITVADYTPGDINDDGKINTKDLTRLIKYINHENVEYNAQALDVNGDGKVNTKDLTRLLRYINRENVEIF